ncbi:aminodeoxychorismate/anthranilate synthase component II [Gilvibacter sp. SZ-19]|jgi:anthranilate synthase component 2|uniref:anthranilate synthase component II n=1 Tax=Gilvibacter sp. SZ-19 TaxID=754429 RepID=UPI000B3C7AB1|nr:aminodeoxychorismate/anthranilate synthase component II [Gilvibacter sp. SZ-19]ARV11261.1 aminodeoxychorismate/anthranilate synthase component II [Gilvibacter sp. SZ-19]
MKILVIDNYDSFVYNLVHYIREFVDDVTVWRNDQFELEDVADFDKIVLSPGPGIPEEAGLLKAVVERYASTKSMLGVCLGQQAIGEVFGGSLINLDQVFHGVGTHVERLVDDEPLFAGLPKNFQVGRYHSWVVAREDFPQDLEITAVDESGQIMALRHKKYDLRGVQFHPESVLTPHGKSMIKNWLNQNNKE